MVNRQLEVLQCIYLCNANITTQQQYQDVPDEKVLYIHTSRESSLKDPSVKSSLPVSSEKALPLLTCSE